MEILHLDEAIIVLNKPAGLAVLPEGWDRDAPCLVRMLEDQYGVQSDGAGHGIWVVHRLDKTTSGVMVFARTADAHSDLNRQFEHHQAQKIYHAVVVGVPPWQEKTARHPLRVNVGHKHRTAVDSKQGKPAETLFTVLQRYVLNALIEAQLMTGRTHQIRVHAYVLGYPLLGDTLYGAPSSELIDRPALHARSLAFTNPLTGQREAYIAPYPVDFSQVLGLLNV